MNEIHKKEINVLKVNLYNSLFQQRKIKKASNMPEYILDRLIKKIKSMHYKIYLNHLQSSKENKLDAFEIK